MATNLGDTVANKVQSIRLGYKVALIKAAAREFAEVLDHINYLAKNVDDQLDNVGSDFEGQTGKIALQKAILILS